MPAINILRIDIGNCAFSAFRKEKGAMTGIAP
jgi:hypothetical protein